MQASLAIPGSLDLSNRSSSGEFDEFAKITQDFSRKVRVNRYVSIAEEEEKPEIEHEHESEDEDDDCVVEEAAEEEEEEFSFATANLDGSPISAEEVFQIRQMYPIFDQSLLYAAVECGDSNDSVTSASSPRPRLKKLFVEERDLPSSSETEDLHRAAAGEYCEWSRKVVEASPGTCRKSNSTGFSKIWRFRDLVRRSSSDGKDAFVFLSSDPASTKKSEKVVATKEVKGTTGSEKVRVKKTTPSAHELHYMKNRAMRKEDKRRSYLPYRQGVVGYGFFTSVNGLSKNVHPY